MKKKDERKTEKLIVCACAVLVIFASIIAIVVYDKTQNANCFETCKQLNAAPIYKEIWEKETTSCECNLGDGKRIVIDSSVIWGEGRK